MIRILPAAPPRPAPDVPPPFPEPGSVGSVPDKKKGDNPLSPLRLARHGKRLLVTLRSAKAGLVVVRANKDGRRIGQCRARVTARQRMTCAIRLDRLQPRVAFICRVPRTTGLRLPAVRVSAALYVKGKRRAVRRLRVGG